MPIKHLPDVAQSTNSQATHELAVVLHGSNNAGITILCHGEESQAVIEAAEFLSSDEVQTNVVQINTLTPFPADQIAALIKTSYHVILIELDVETDLYKLIHKHTGIKLTHTHYFNPKHARVQARIVSLIKELFTFSS